MSKRNQNYTNRKQNRFQPERMRGTVFVNNSGKQWLPGENVRAAKVERLLRGTKEKKKEIAGNMAGYKDSGVEEVKFIPKDWNTLRMKDAFNISKEIIGDKWTEAALLSLTTNGVKSITADEQVGKRPKTFATYQRVTKNDIVMCLFDLDASAVFSGLSGYDGMISPAYKILKTKEQVLPEFANYYFQYIFEGRKYKKYAKSIRYTLSGEEFLRLLIVVPPLPEQQRIADFLDTKCGILDRTIDAVSRQIEDLEKYKKALITKTVTKGICKKGEPERAMKDSGVEWIGEVPEEWSVSKVKYNFSTFKKIPGKESEKYERLSLTMNGVKHREKWTAEGLQPKDFMSYQLLRKGDLVFRLIDLQNPSKSRRVALSHDTGLISPAYTILHADNNKMLPEYAEMFFLMMSYLDVFNALGSCGVRSSINNAELMKISVLVPPLAEQQQIADYLDEKCKNINNRVQKRRQQLEWLKKYKKSLIFDYVTGKKRVEK